MKRYVLAFIIGSFFAINGMERIKHFFQEEEHAQPNISSSSEKDLKDRQESLKDKIHFAFLNLENRKKALTADELIFIFLPLRRYFSQDVLITNNLVDFIIEKIKKNFPHESYNWIREQLQISFPEKEFPFFNKVLESRIQHMREIENLSPRTKKHLSPRMPKK